MTPRAETGFRRRAGQVSETTERGVGGRREARLGDVGASGRFAHLEELAEVYAFALTVVGRAAD